MGSFDVVDHSGNELPPVQCLVAFDNGWTDDPRTFTVASPTQQTWLDGSQNANHAVTAGPNLALTGGLYGKQAPQFVAGSYLQIANNLSLINSKPFTIECWLNRQSNVSASYATIINNSWGPAISNWWLGFYNNTIELAAVVPAGYAIVTSSATITDSAWHHVAAMYDGYNFWLLIDGVPSGTPTTSPSLSPSTFAARSSQIGLSSLGTLPYLGVLDEIRLSSSVRYTPYPINAQLNPMLPTVASTSLPIYVSNPFPSGQVFSIVDENYNNCQTFTTTAAVPAGSYAQNVPIASAVVNYPYNTGGLVNFGPAVKTSTSFTGTRTTLPVVALDAAIPSGSTVQLGIPGGGPNNYVSVITNAAAAAGATSLPIPSTAFGARVWPAGMVGSQLGGGGASFLQPTLLTSGPVTSLPIYAAVEGLPPGPVTISQTDYSVTPNVLHTQTFTTTGIATGATSIPVTSATPNFLYSQGARVALPSGFVPTLTTSVAFPLTPITALAVQATARAVPAGPFTVTGGGHTQTFMSHGAPPNSTYVLVDTATPVYAFPAGSTLYLGPFTADSNTTALYHLDSAAPAGTLVPNQWTDITATTRTFAMSGRGRQHDLAQFGAASATFTIDNADGRYSPWNTAGPYYGNLLPRKWVQFRTAAGQPRFTGHVSGWAPQWTNPGLTNVEIDANDPLRFLNNTNLVSFAYPLQCNADGAQCLYRFDDADTSARDNSVLTFNDFPVNPPGAYNAGALPGGSAPLVTDTNGSATLLANGQISLPPIASIAGAYALNLYAEALGTTLYTGAASMPVPAWSVEAMVTWPPLASPPPVALPYQYIYYDPNGTSGAYNNVLMAIALMTDGSIGVYGPGGGSPFVQSAPNSVRTDGYWHHVVVTVLDPTGNATGGAPPSQVVIYVDGVPIEVAATAMQGYGFAPATPTAPIQVGNAANNLNPTGYGTMSIANLAVYPLALTYSQVVNHWQIIQRGRGTATYVGQVLYYASLSSARINECLDIVGWSPTARTISTGTTQCQIPSSSSVSTSALSAMQSVEFTEGGALFAGLDGSIVFIDRNTLQTTAYTTSAITFGDGPTELAFQPSPQLPTDDVDIVNYAKLSRQNGLDQIITNYGSIAQFGQAVYQGGGTLLHLSDQQTVNRGQYIVTRHGKPYPRFDQITIDMREASAKGQLAAMLNLDLLKRVTVNRAAMPGTPFSGIFLVESVNESITATTWTMTFSLAAADRTVYLLADVTPVGAAAAYY